MYKSLIPFLAILFIVSCNNPGSETNNFATIALKYPEIKNDTTNIRFREVEYKDSFDYSRFPLLIGGNKNITEKINSFISKRELDLDYKKAKKNIFEQITKNRKRGMMGRGFPIDYEIHLLNDNFYSVTISGEDCGAYCENHDTRYNFDLKTGNQIELLNLINTNKLTQLLDTLNLIRETMINGEIKRADSILKFQKIDSSELEYYTEMLELFIRCIEYKLESFEYLDFYFTPKELIITSERCSVHYNRAMDEIGEFKYKLDYVKWAHFFSDYGKNVIAACATVKVR